MSSETLHVIMAMAGQQPPAGQAPNPTAQMIQMVSMLALMGVVFYFLLIRPQQKKAKEQQNMLSNLKSGDKILTSSGIIGVVITVKDKTVSIRSMDTKLEITKGAVAEITERGGDAPQS
jgi:preprotein translocase subunit YajC